MDRNDVVLTEKPTYLAAIQAFQSYEARFVSVPTDAEGIISTENLPPCFGRIALTVTMEGVCGTPHEFLIRKF